MIHQRVFVLHNLISCSKEDKLVVYWNHTESDLYTLYEVIMKLKLVLLSKR